MNASPPPIIRAATTRAAATAERLSADARVILDCIAALGGISDSRGVPESFFEELRAAGCIAPAGAAGWVLLDLGTEAVAVIRERQALIRRALGGNV